MRNILGALLLAAPMVAPATWTAVNNTPLWAKVNTDSGVGLTANIRGLAYTPYGGGRVVASDTSGNLAVLNPTTGAVIATVTGAQTTDATISLFRVRVSDDGQVFTSGFAGGVRNVGNLSAIEAGSPFNAGGPLASDLPAASLTGSSRSLFVAGNYAAGTAYVLVGRGANLIIYGNTPATPAVFTELAAFATGSGGDIHGIWATSDLSIIRVITQGASSKEFDINTPGNPAGGYTEDLTYVVPSTTDNLTFRGSYDWAFDDADGGVVGARGSATGSTGSGFTSHLVVQVAGYPGWTGLGTAVTAGNTSYVADGNYLTGVSIATNAVGAVALDPVNDVVYGSATNSITAWDITATAPSSVADWQILD